MEWKAQATEYLHAPQLPGYHAGALSFNPSHAVRNWRDQEPVMFAKDCVRAEQRDRTVPRIKPGGL